MDTEKLTDDWKCPICGATTAMSRSFTGPLYCGPCGVLGGQETRMINQGPTSERDQRTTSLLVKVFKAVLNENVATMRLAIEAMARFNVRIIATQTLAEDMQKRAEFAEARAVGMQRRAEGAERRAKINGDAFDNAMKELEAVRAEVETSKVEIEGLRMECLSHRQEVERQREQIRILEENLRVAQRMGD